MLGWCGLNPTQERLIPPLWKQLKAETTNTGNTAVLTHLLDPSNVGGEEVNIFLRKQLVTDIMTQNFGFGYTIAYGTTHHGVTPFAVPSLDPTTMAQIDTAQQEEDGATMITVADKKNAAKGPPTQPSSYTEFFTVLQNYQALLKVLFGTHCQHFTQVKNITQTVKAMFLRNNGIINEIQRANLIWSIHCDARDFFGNFATAADLQNDTGQKAALRSIHTLIGANIALSLQDVPAQLYVPTQTTTGAGGAGGQGKNPRKTKESDR